MIIQKLEMSAIKSLDTSKGLSGTLKVPSSSDQKCIHTRKAYISAQYAYAHYMLSWKAEGVTKDEIQKSALLPYKLRGLEFTFKFAFCKVLFS